MQAAAWRAQQTCQSDQEQARLLSANDRDRYVQELQDRLLAQRLETCLVDEQQEHAVGQPDFTSSSTELLVVARVQGNQAGYAAQLITDSGNPSTLCNLMQS